MQRLPRVMVGGPIRDREWAVPAWLGSLLGTSYPPELLSLVVVVNDSSDGTLEACHWWAARARAEGWARAEVHVHNLGCETDNNARRGERDYSAFARLRDMWASLADGEAWLYPVDSDVQVPHYLLQGLVNLARIGGWDLLSAVIENNWSPAPEHATNVVVADGEGGSAHSRLAFCDRAIEARPCLVTGACCVLRGELYDAGFRYFDPTADPHPPEDNTFCARLVACGRRIGYVPGLRATHWSRPPVETEWVADPSWWRRLRDYADNRIVAVAPRIEAVA